MLNDIANVEHVMLPNKKLFVLKDVPGDGNCFFHAVVLSDNINMSRHDDLRRFLVNSIKTSMGHQETKLFVEKLYNATAPLMPSTQWLDSIA